MDGRFVWAHVRGPLAARGTRSGARGGTGSSTRRGALTPVEVACPVPVGSRPPTALGDGRWVTPGESGDVLRVWARD